MKPLVKDPAKADRRYAQDVAKSSFKALEESQQVPQSNNDPVSENTPTGTDGGRERQESYPEEEFCHRVAALVAPTGTAKSVNGSTAAFAATAIVTATVAFFWPENKKVLPDGLARKVPPARAPRIDSIVHTFEGHTDAVTGVALSGDGKLVLTGSDDKTAILWDAAISRGRSTSTWSTRF